MKIKSRVRQVRLNYQAQIGRPVELKEVSEATGITESALSRIERGLTQRVDFETLAKLCRFYGLTPGDLLEYVEAKPPVLAVA